MHFVKLVRPCHDLVLFTYVENPPVNLSLKVCAPWKYFFGKTSPSPYFRVGGDNMKWSLKIRLKGKRIN